MRVRLEHSKYGPTAVRLFRVSRKGSRHDIKEATLAIEFEGDFESAHTSGDNTKILPTDTIRNTVYVLAKQYSPEPIEEFASHLIEHFFTYNPQVSRIRIDTKEQLWDRIRMGAKSHDSAFARTRAEQRTSLLVGTRNGIEIWAGVNDLVILKSAKSGFEGFARDPYTTLKETSDHVFAAKLSASWRYLAGEIAYSAIWHGVRQSLLESFAEHESRSPQQTIYAMADAVLRNFESLAEIRLSMALQEYDSVDLSPFGMQNANEIFAPAGEPESLVEATVRRDI
ncbi:MAG: urate oxidase [Candidatus Acidiferrales bacterium]